MIIFKTISARNFFSIGNKPIEIRLDDSKCTLVRGDNSSGKSSLILDTIFFALFGKSFRKINNGNMINKSNNKNMVVELTFDIGANEYKIIRGYKPGIFEIYVNGTLKPFNNVKDYQDIVTAQIIQMNEKTFRQLIIIGSASYVPFMLLSATERRVVIEDLLNLEIFSDMTQQAKQDVVELKTKIFGISSEIDKIQTQIDNVNKNSGELAKIINENIQNTQNSKTEIVAVIKDFTDKRAELEARLNVLEMSELEASIKKLNSSFSQAENMMRKCEIKNNSYIKNKSFFESNETCPSCTQQISKEFKQIVFDKINTNISNIENDMNIIKSKMSEISENKTKLVSSYTAYKNIQTEIRNINVSIQQKEQQTELLNNQLNKLQEQLLTIGTNIEADIAALKNLLSNVTSELEEEQSELTAYEIILKMLSDDGIKKLIIKKYLPVFKTLIQKYLSIIGFYASFSFDEKFNETIKIKNRDEYEYNNLSEGEKLRIDMSILFAMREFAKLKSTIATNLLIFDEFDKGVMDANGFTAIKDIINNCISENIIVISHASEHFLDLADRIIDVTKNNNFSSITVTKT